MTPSPTSTKRPIPRIVREILSLGLFLLIGLSARSSLADHYIVPSESMLPSVRIDDHIAVNKLAFGLRVPFSQTYLNGAGPSRSDVVVLKIPDEKDVLLKRVVALPGDRVAVLGGRVVIDGVPAPIEVDGSQIREFLSGHGHLLDLSRGGGPDLPETVVPQGMYLLLGDNRGNSRDGRYFGFVPRSAILGRALGIFLREGTPVWIGL
jgi:signal peptidase I